VKVLANSRPVPKVRAAQLTFMRRVQEACARLDVAKALATDPAENGETGEEP